MPTSDQEYDAERIKLLLDDLEKRTRNQAGFVQLEQQALSRGPLNGIATRAGLVRLGVDIARVAHAADCDAICIRRDGVLTDQDTSGVINIVLGDESAFEKPQPTAWSTHVGCGLTLAVIVATAILAVIGLVTVWNWVAG